MVKMSNIKNGLHYETLEIFVNRVGSLIINLQNGARKVFENQEYESGSVSALESRTICPQSIALWTGANTSLVHMPKIPSYYCKSSTNPGYNYMKQMPWGALGGGTVHTPAFCFW